MESDTSAQVRTIEERLMKAMEEKHYDDAWVIGRDLLPLLSLEQRGVRLRLYVLLGQCPGHALTEEEQERVSVLAEEAMVDARAGAEEKVYAHLLYLALGPPGHQGEVATLKGKLPTEVREMQGLQAAQKLLGRGNAEREDQLAALSVACQTSLDDAEIGSYCEALLLAGEERYIADACCGMPLSFHAATRCAYLDRALAATEDPGRYANLLDKKLSALVQMLAGLSDERDVEDEELFGGIYNGVQETYALLQLVGTATHRAWSHIHMAQYVHLFGNEEGVDFHLTVADAMAKALGDVDITHTVQRMRELVEGEEDGNEGKGEEGEEWKMV